MKRFIMIAAAAVALSACATATMPSYQAATSAGSVGYMTAPADNGRYTIAYTGDKRMSRQQVAEYAMLRAAEFTAEQGQEWFAVIETASQKVEDNSVNDLSGRSGGFLGSESTGTGAGGAGPGGVSGPPGTRDATVSGGPSTGGFGGGDVPYQVVERWKPPTVFQTVMIIQMGSGEQAAFEGLERAPEIFGAKAVADEIRAKMAP
jgi:hypothetical protein